MAVFCLRRKHTANASEPAVRKKRMSEECTHDCSSCGAACSSRDAAPKHDAPNPNSSVKKVIGVVSGKGGVGKSMTSALLACAMARRGYHCGILDADITGPSIPKLFGIHGRAMADEKGCWPIQSRMGIDVMSINLLVENEEDPVVWRGPVIAGAVKQFWTDVIWGDLDYLFVDMPPGTGDIQLTLSQQVPVTGAIVVTTPQDIATLDAVKGLMMFRKVNIPVLGIVENMALFKCPHCGHLERIFGEGGAERMSKEYGVPVLGSLPLERGIREDADSGHPTVLAEPDSETAEIFRAIARKTAVALSETPKDFSSGIPKVTVQNAAPKA